MGQKSYGTSLNSGNSADYGTSTTWTKLAKLKSIDPPAPSADSIDTTHLESPSEHKEKVAGWADAGQCKATIQYSSTQAATVYGLFRTMKGYKILFPDSSGIGFTGFISEFGTPVDEKGIVTNDVTIEVTGPIIQIAAP